MQRAGMATEARLPRSHPMRSQVHLRCHRPCRRNPQGRRPPGASPTAAWPAPQWWTAGPRGEADHPANWPAACHAHTAPACQPTPWSHACQSSRCSVPGPGGMTVAHRPGLPVPSSPGAGELRRQCWWGPPSPACEAADWQRAWAPALDAPPVGRPLGPGRRGGPWSAREQGAALPVAAPSPWCSPRSASLPCLGQPGPAARPSPLPAGGFTGPWLTPCLRLRRRPGCTRTRLAGGSQSGGHQRARPPHRW